MEINMWKNLQATGRRSINQDAQAGRMIRVRSSNGRSMSWTSKQESDTKRLPLDGLMRGTSDDSRSISVKTFHFPTFDFNQFKKDRPMLFKAVDSSLKTFVAFSEPYLCVSNSFYNFHFLVALIGITNLATIWDQILVCQKVVFFVQPVPLKKFNFKPV